METNNKYILVCNCEGTMALNIKALSSTLGGSPVPISQLCRAQLNIFEEAANTHEEVVVACTQEAPIFLEAAEELASGGRNLNFCNIREKAGWCQEKAGSASSNLTAKMAALLTESTLEIPQTPSVMMTSKGNVLVLGKGEEAMSAANKISKRLDVTVILENDSDVLAPRVMGVPIFQGHALSASGYLGAFEVKIKGSSPASPSNRAGLAFTENGKDGVIECDLILDLRGETPLFNAPEKRDGYFNADPRSPALVAETIFELIEMVGEFEKPRYIDYDPDICAHAKNGISGCNKCIDACPAGAITSYGDKVAYDPYICAGCGNCASICPTGAAKYSMPAGDFVYERLRVLLNTYYRSGGSNAVLLIHDTSWGEDMIASMARYGDGLPSNVLPFAAKQVTSTGLEMLLAAAAYGAEHVCILAEPKKIQELEEVQGSVDLANRILDGIGYGTDRVFILDNHDPVEIGSELYKLKNRPGVPKAEFMAMGRKRSVMGQALRTLYEEAPNPVEVLELHAGAPFGAVNVDVNGCTLCLACVGACPTGALKDNPDIPQLSFNEQSCVQCGLCRNTCPEKVITLKPQISFLDSARIYQVIKEEEPLECLRCGKPFGAKSTIESMVSKLEGHSMFADAKALDRLRMCEDCRVIALTEDEPQPMAYGSVPKPRTTDDYLRERDELQANAITDINDKGSVPPIDHET